MENKCPRSIIHKGLMLQAWIYARQFSDTEMKELFECDKDVYDYWYLTQTEYFESEYLEPDMIFLN